MKELLNLAQYLFDTDQRLIANLINKVNTSKKQDWRLTSYSYFDYDLLNPETPYRIASLSRLENLLYALYKLEQAGMNAEWYIVERELGLIPFESVEQAIEQSIGMEQFLNVYLEPYFRNEEEYLEDLPEAVLYLKECLK